MNHVLGVSVIIFDKISKEKLVNCLARIKLLES